MALGGCSNEPAPSASPDPYSNVARQADDAYAQGVELLQERRFTEALTAFQRARLLSPTVDPRIDEMIQRSAAELTPSPTPAPPTSTPLPEPTPIVQNQATPSAALGDEYFGQVFLTIVPGRAGMPPPMTRFSNQDQIGLFVEHLNQRLRMAYSLRVFDADSGHLVADVRSDALQRFKDRFVWLHEGGDQPGRYHAELYAGDVLTHTFEYVVGTEPVPIPSPTPAPSATPMLVPIPPPVSQQAPVEPTSIPRPAQPNTAAPGPVPVAAPPPTTPVPAPAPATSILVSGVPAALAVVPGSDQLYVADRSGLVWSLEHARPTLRRPFSVSGQPIGLAVEPTGERLYVAVRGGQPAIVVLDTATGGQMASVPLPADPGDIELDPTLGLLYVIVPDRATVDAIDIRNRMQIVQSTPGLADVTGLALDASKHVLYVSHLGGEVSVIDGQTATVTGRLGLSAAGLAGVAFVKDQVYAINAPGRELLVVDPATQDVRHIMLGGEPDSIEVGPLTGTAYVLETATNAVLRLDPNDGTEIGWLSLGEAGPGIAPALQPDQLWLRPRMVINALDERAYVIEPGAGIVAISPTRP